MLTDGATKSAMRFSSSMPNATVAVYQPIAAFFSVTSRSGGCLIGANMPGDPLYGDTLRYVSRPDFEQSRMRIDDGEARGITQP